MYPKIDKYSDGKTPEAKAQQILAITPIVKGQTSQQNNLPPKQQQMLPQAQIQARQPPVSASGGDLIDFGSDHVGQPPESNPTTMQTNTSQQQGTPKGLQQPLQPGQPIKRQDTITSEVDEFVDAKDGE